MPVPVLAPGRGKTKTSWFSTLARDDRPWSGADPPGVVYFYAPRRGGKHGQRVLDGFPQVDDYVGCKCLVKCPFDGAIWRWHQELPA